MTKARDLADFSATTGVVDADIGSTVQAYDSNLTSFVSAFTLPTSDGSNGQALVTNGSGTVAFSNVDSLPSQTSNSGKFLTTDGTDASWGTPGGGSFEYISSATASSGTTYINFTGLTDYDAYHFIFIGLRGDTNNGFRMQLSNDNGSTWYSSSNVYHQPIYQSYYDGESTNGGFGGFVNQSAGWYLGSQSSNLSGVNGFATLYNVNTTSKYPTFMFQTSQSWSQGYHLSMSGSGQMRYTYAANAVRFYAEEAEWLNGNIHMYGIKTS